MSGHLFIVRSDLIQLVCDAWLVPSDAWLTVESAWTDALPEGMSSREALRAFAPPDFGRERNAFPLSSASGEAIPYVTNVGGVGLAQLPAHVVEFLDSAATEFSASRIRGRDLPLFALPLVGTGHGGWDQAKGEVTRTVVHALADWVAANDADAALVCRTRQAFAAAQSARRRLTIETPLRLPLAERAAWLGSQASLGRLVLFLGAGLGLPAGLPSWNELLMLLAADAGIKANETEELMKLNALDAALIIEARLGEDPERFGRVISAHVGGKRRFSLGHALLASLPVTESVTTNYDKLFESAAQAAGRTLAILPYDAPRGDGWLLKLHGCVDRRPNDIVLTRGDYLRYADRRAALAGIVQAMLITRQMLFIGFSLNDENFIRIADDVRKAVRGQDEAPNRKFGTALFVEENELLSELWADDLDCLSVAPDVTEGGRHLDLFLDQTLAHASTGAEHLLDPTFEGALDEGEVALTKALREFRDNVPEIARATPAWAGVENALRGLGWPTPPADGSS